MEGRARSGKLAQQVHREAVRQWGQQKELDAERARAANFLQVHVRGFVVRARYRDVASVRRHCAADVFLRRLHILAGHGNAQSGAQLCGGTALGDDKVLDQAVKQAEKERLQLRRDHPEHTELAGRGQALARLPGMLW